MTSRSFPSLPHFGHDLQNFRKCFSDSTHAIRCFRITREMCQSSYKHQCFTKPKNYEAVNATQSFAELLKASNFFHIPMESKNKLKTYESSLQHLYYIAVLQQNSMCLFANEKLLKTLSFLVEA